MAMKDEKICTIYENIYRYKTPHQIKLHKALNRIKTGASAEVITRLRAEQDENMQDAIKKTLPVLVFTGVFEARRDDAMLPGTATDLMILDFDHVGDTAALKLKLAALPYVYACWVSPRGEGVKALIRIASHEHYREHFLAIQQEMPDVDKSGKNISRACYESYDPEIYINPAATAYTKTIIEEVKTTIERTFKGNEEVYQNIRKWLENKSEAFVSGNRNNYVFLLAGACCRYGIEEHAALDYILRDFSTSDFSQHEIRLTTRSAYRANTFGCASFEENKLVTTTSRKEVEITEMNQGFEEFSHVIFAEQVKADGLNIYKNGYENLVGIGAPVVDYYYKAKRQEVTLMSGYGNMGKSTFLLWYLLNRAVLYGERFALFPPESAPAEEFYLELVEMLAGCDCSAYNPNRPPEHVFTNYWNFINEHFYFVYPETVSPTIATVKESFLELIIKFKVDGVVIDPFNQLSHERGGNRREDWYLEEVLRDFTKFAQQNNIYFWIVAHPNGTVEREDGDIKAPDMFRISGGGMWANKMHNILIYHRPNSKTQPTSPLFTLTTEKIKKQKSVGKRGTFEAHYMLAARRFLMPFWDSHLKSYDLHNLYDPLENNIGKSKYLPGVKPLPKIMPTPEIF